MTRKSVLVILFNILIIFNLFSQNNQSDSESENIIKTQYTIIESDSKSYSSFFGSNRGLLSFDLVELKNLSNNSKLFGVEINIKTSTIEQNSSSIAFANIGRLWGVSASVTYNNIRNSGYTFLTKNDLDSIINFLNGVIGATGQAQEKYTIYRISLRNQFEIGMIYDITISEGNKWGFIFSLKNTAYRLNYQDGLAMLRSLIKFYKYIKDNQVD